MKPNADVREDLLTRLSGLAADYAEALGRDDGLEVMAEQLCRLADDEQLYTKGWAGLIQLLMRASG